MLTMTFYEGNPDVKPVGAEVAEFVDAPSQVVERPWPGEQSGVAEANPRPNEESEPTAETVAERPSATTYIRIYINDHRGGASGGIELARRCERRNRGSALGDEMKSIVEDVRVDAASLDRIGDHLQVAPNRWKQAAAVVAERAGRLKLNGELRRYSPLSRLLELEMMLSAIDAKRSLWRALMAGGVTMPPRIDLQELEHRASDQRSRLEPHHEAAARAVLWADSAR
jgi:hypothetical protein